MLKIYKSIKSCFQLSKM